MKTEIRKQILLSLYAARRDGLTEAAIFAELGGNKKENKKIRAELDEMKQYGHIGLNKGHYFLKNYKRYYIGTVTKAAKTHGFVQLTLAEGEEPEEVFVRGRDLLGSVPGDKVFVKVIAEKDENNRSRTGVVIAVTEASQNIMSGIIVDYNGEIRVVPSSFASQVPLVIVGFGGFEVRVGDKVRFEFKKRGERHSEHVVTITNVYGDSEYAKVSVDAYIEEKAIPSEFPEEVIREALNIQAHGISQSEIASREDLRDIPIFTIDGADTKDIDDAISVEKTEDGFNLGVHIADVSYYVRKGTALDKEAHERGTSVYIANRVIPMLPKELSNGICSLNPMEERLAFSCLMKMDKGGIIKDFRFVKSVIRSRVQGVYSEVNKILDGTASDEINEKYKEVIACMPAMQELAAILEKNRTDRGAPEIDSVESKIICDENGVCIDIKARDRGVSEAIIEEFMLAANNCAARVGMENNIPFVYRVHEPPAAEKLLSLADTLTMLGFDAKGINEHSCAGDMAAILRKAKEDPRAMIINRLTLRTMMKARYSEEPLGHFGLVMKEYAHFTSPIRRLADLSIHRILSDYVGGEKSRLGKYERFAKENALQASNTEIRAVNAERDCEKFYAAEFMKNHVGEQFDGIISGVINSGFFVELPNTVEGRVDTFTLPEGIYEARDNILLVETLSNKAYTVGDKVKVTVAAANVGAGQIDFTLDEHVPMAQ